MQRSILRKDTKKVDFLFEDGNIVRKHGNKGVSQKHLHKFKSERTAFKLWTPINKFSYELDKCFKKDSKIKFPDKK
jgi:hypothetical protein